jgi:hypothetical protein
MTAFQFPDPAVEQTVVNTLTGSTYQWKEDPGKWVVTAKLREVSDIIWEGDDEPDPNPGDYKLWYHTDKLELYFWYEDVNGVGAWVPTSAPITMIEDLDIALNELRTDVQQVNQATSENENRIGRTIEYSDTAPKIWPEEEYNGEFFFNELNFKFWYDTSRLELLVLYKDPDDGAYSYVPVALPLTNLDLDALNTQVQANSYSNNQQSQAIVALEELIVQNFEDHEEIKNDIVELEEEIDAIAPSNERGEWNFNPLGVASPSYYAFLDNNTQPTERFDGAAIIYVSTRDADSTTHSFTNHEAGEYLQIFNKEGNGYGLYLITDIDDYSSSPNPFFAFTVDYVRSLVTAPKAENRGRFKFFTIADANASEIYEYVNDRLEGVASRYTLENVLNNPVTDGYFSTNNPFYLNVREFSFGAKDLDGGVTKKLLNDDIIEIFDPSDNAKIRYKITDASNAPSVVKVEHISGIVNFNINAIHQVQIYPASEEVEIEQALIQVLPGNPANPQVGEAWFSTNQNVFIIKIS